MKAGKKKTLIFLGLSLMIATVIFIVVFSFVFKNEGLKKGKLEIFDQTGILLAHTDQNGKLLYESACEDYIKNVTDEALKRLSYERSKEIKYKDLLNSDTKIITYFSKNSQSVLCDSFKNVSFEDSKAAEAAICTPDGRIIACVGKANARSVITKKHKAGSAIKPLSVYAPSLKKGKIVWSTGVKDLPFKKVTEKGIKRDWPSNATGQYSGKTVLLPDAIKKSLNTVAVFTLDSLGVEDSCEFLSSVGVDVTYEKQYATAGICEDVYGNLALGELKAGVTCEQLAAAYQIFANGGSYTEMRLISKIISGKKTLYTDSATKAEILKPCDAEIMNLLLQEVVSPEGTAANAQIEGIKVAGKTGTSQGYKDNWFVGLTPDYICAVWYGYDEPQKERGANISLEIFKNTVSALEHKTADFPHSNEVIEAEFCVYTGGLSKGGCNVSQKGYFNKTRLPEVCQKH